MVESEEPLSSLWKDLSDRFPLSRKSFHGPAHWKRVEKNGLILAPHVNAEESVIRLFALFHDSCRQNESIDPGHGDRGADLAIQYRSAGAFVLEDRFMDLLVRACRKHTDGTVSRDPTIGACWDADRLDLARVGIIPNPHYLSTWKARKGDVIHAAVKRSREAGNREPGRER